MTDVRTNAGSASQAARPRPRPVQPVRWGRIIAGTAAVTVVAGSSMVLGRMMGSGAAASAAAFLLGVAVVPLIASPLEWLVHRFVYHAPAIPPLAAIFRVHTAHHFAFFPTWRYATHGQARRLAIRSRATDVHVTPLRNAGVRLAHFGWYMAIGLVTVWVPAWFITQSRSFLIGAVIGTAIVSNLFIVVHDTIHRPGSHRLVQAQPWFGFLDRHHWIHHIDLGANLNFLLPLADLLFGTLRTTVSASEVDQHGTLADAKARRVGSGERAAVS